MNDKKIKRLKLMQRLLKQQVDKAAISLSEVLSILYKEEEKSKSIISYQDEYKKKLDSLNTNTNNINNYKINLNFIDHLEHLQEQQTATFTKINVEVEKRKQHWTSLHNRFKSLDNLIKKLEKERDVQLAKEEQLELDALINDLYAIKITNAQNFD